MPKTKKPKTIDPAVSSAAASLGRTGGKSGTGDAKRRSNDHYAVTLAESRRKAAMLRKLKGE